MSDYRSLDLTNPFVTNFPLFNALAVSGMNVYTAIAGPLSDLQTFTFHAEWSTGFSGTIQILGSLDGVNFRNFGVSVAAQPANSKSGVLIPLYGHGMKWLQFVYTNASGSGAMTTLGLGKTR